jgi:hypothetical protein
LAKANIPLFFPKAQPARVPVFRSPKGWITPFGAFPDRFMKIVTIFVPAGIDKYAQV